MNPYAFARFTTRGLPGGAIEITCTRCRTADVLGPDDPLREDVTLSDQLVWAKDHKCPPPKTRPARARELVAA